MVDIAFCTGEEIVEADNFVPLFQQPIDEVGAQKACATSDQDTFAAVVKSCQSRFPSENVVNQVV